MHTESSQVSFQLLNNIRQLPLWVKEVIYLELGKDLGRHISLETLHSWTSQDTIAFWVPQFTEAGETVIAKDKDDMSMLVKAVQARMTVLDVCLHYQWSLERCCQALLDGISRTWISPPESLKALGTIEYLANTIRLGEFLVKMGRITPEQLDQSLRAQQYIKEALNEHSGLANILINLGYITKKDTEGILFLKEESRQPLGALALLPSPNGV